MTDERQNGSAPGIADVRQEIEDLKKAQAVQAATDAGAHATQAATQAGLASMVVTGSVALVVGMLLGSLFTNVGR